MLRIITAATALTVLVACDSEGIDRARTSDQMSNQTTSAGTENQTASNTTESGTTESESNSGDTSTSTDTGGMVSDDAATSTAEGDGNQSNSDDAASSTSDGGQTISADAASSTSDGGQTISADAASSTSDGGQVVANDPVTTEPATQTAANSATNTNAGNFASETGNGNVIRRSTLSSDTSETKCTVASNPDDYSNIFVGDFILHNNAWRTFRAYEGFEWEQCISTNINGAVVSWNYDWGPGRTGINNNPKPSGDYFVRSYPELIYGTKDEFRTSGPQSVTGLPVKISEMPTFQIDFSYDAPQDGVYDDVIRTVDASNNPRFPNGTEIFGERNVAVESFFYEADQSGNCTPGIVTRNGGSTHTYEVMVWLDAGAERLPAGPDDFVADLTIRGANYKVYTKGSDPRYIAFVAQNPQTTGTIYMNDYIDWARENAHKVVELFGANRPTISNSVEIQDDWCMANILVGTEIFWGAGDMNIYDWTITQTQ